MNLRVLATTLALTMPLNATAAASETVVLLHGLGRGPWAFKLLEWRLESAGYDVQNIRYDTRSGTIEEAAASVHARLLECCVAAQQVHFVTHSLGGLVLRSLLADYEVSNAGRAVQLAPPNRGSEIVDRLAHYAFFRSILGPLATQLGTDEASLPQRLPPPSIPFGVIAGTRWLNPVGAVLLPAPNDGTVSVEATRLPEMDDHLVVPHTHTFIMNSSAVAEAICSFLATGRLDPSSEDPQ